MIFEMCFKQLNLNRTREINCNISQNLAYSHLSWGGKQRERADIQTQTVILVGGKKLPCIKLRLSEFLQLLNDLGTLFTLMYYELSFPSLYKDTQCLKISLPSIQHFLWFLYVFFSCKMILLHVSRNNTDLLDPPLFCFCVLFMGRTGSNLCI